MDKESVDKNFIKYNYFQGNVEQSHHGARGCPKLSGDPKLFHFLMVTDICCI